MKTYSFKTLLAAVALLSSNVWAQGIVYYNSRGQSYQAPVVQYYQEPGTTITYPAYNSSTVTIYNGPGTQPVYTTPAPIYYQPPPPVYYSPPTAVYHNDALPWMILGAASTALIYEANRPGRHYRPYHNHRPRPYNPHRRR